MAYGTPADPVGGTVITVAYAVANLLDPIRWLRLLTGNADPPGSNYVVVSTSTSGTNWAKITTDVLADLAVTNAKMAVGAAALNIGAGGVSASMLAAGAALSNLTFTPINKAGDSGIGTLALGPGKQISFATENGTKVDLAGNGQYLASVASNVWKMVTARDFEVWNSGAGGASLVYNTSTHTMTLNGNTVIHTGSTGGVSAGMLASGAAVSNIGFTPARVAKGTYTGNDAATQDIALGFTPAIVFIHNPATGVGIYHNSGDRTTLGYSGNLIVSGTGGIISGGFQAISGANNAGGTTYYYTAIG